MKKKTIWAIVCILSLGLGYQIFYFNQYDIEDREMSIHSGLVKWTDRSSETATELRILEITRISDTSSHIVLFETADKNIGYAHLLKGWNGKYKIELSGWGTNFVSYQDIKTNKGTYAIMAGKNPYLQIDHVIAESPKEEFSFTVNTSHSKTFLAYKKLPNQLKETFLADINFYNKNKKVIESLRE